MNKYGFPRRSKHRNMSKLYLGEDLDKTTNNTANKSVTMLSLVFLLCLPSFINFKTALVRAHESIRACRKDRCLDVGLNSNVFNRLLVARLMLLYTQTIKKEPDKFDRKYSAGQMEISGFSGTKDSKKVARNRINNKRENRKENNVFLFFF